MNSLFYEPKYWLTALKRGNVSYSNYWSGEDAKPFYSVSVRTEFGAIYISFEFNNFEACMTEQEAADNADF